MTMANYPNDLRYTTEHAWVRVRDQVATIGISDYAQRQLGEVVAVELHAPGRELAATDPFGTVESVKAVTEVYMPVSGTISEVNEALNEGPSPVNADPYGEGRMVKLRSPSTQELDGLMSSDAYAKYVESADT
jgi:glycine cleavage system H protein